MIHEDAQLYAPRLTAMANTRLLFNTVGELEDFFGNHAIHSNGMRRCFPTLARLRAAYRDCQGEVENLTDGMFNFDWLMRHYERAWLFYKARFQRRKRPDQIALRLLRGHYGLLAGQRVTDAERRLAQDADDARVDVAILTLLLLKALPGYDSKGGDVTDIDEQFGRVADFLEAFTDGCGVFDVLPVIRLAREEKRRTRLMLVYHTVGILDTYEHFLTPDSITQTTLALRDSAATLRMEGIWLEDGAQAFWEMERTVNDGIFFATRYLREGKRLLTVMRYTLQLIKAEGNRLTAFLLHPAAMKHRLAGRPYTDEDSAWFIADAPADDWPDSLTLVRTMQSAHWPLEITLRRVGSPALAERYRYEIDAFTTIDPYEDCRYTLEPSLYAVTQQAAYVVDEREDCLYRLPRYTDHRFETITIDDNVGILEIGPAGARRRYLALDSRLLYIPLTPRHLARYGIERTDEIE